MISATPIGFCGSKHLQWNQIMDRTGKCRPQNYIMSKDTDEIKEGHCIENVRLCTEVTITTARAEMYVVTLGAAANRSILSVPLGLPAKK